MKVYGNLKHVYADTFPTWGSEGTFPKNLRFGNFLYTDSRAVLDHIYKADVVKIKI